MNVHELIHGSPEWHSHRASHLNASDAPAMMSVSPYKTRQQLLNEYASGIAIEVDAATQRRFDDGHRFEELARPLAEEIIGEDLYPVTGSSGKFSASFDGLTMSEEIAFEHKSLNEELRSVMVDGCTGADLPLLYRVQMEQQCMVSGCKRVLFMASKWRGDDLAEAVTCWYEPDMKLREDIIAHWLIFETDLVKYQKPEVVEKPTAESVEAFPVPTIQVRGELVACNLTDLLPKFDKFLTETKTKLENDQDFADGEANAKHSREAAKNMKLTAKAVVDQIAPVSEVVRTLELYADKFDKLGLVLEKAVKEQKETIKSTAINQAKVELARHVIGLEAEINPILLAFIQPDFAGAIKGIRTIESMNERIDAVLRNSIVEVGSIAKDIRDKLAWCKANAEGYGFLFIDLQQIIYKDVDDFQLLVKSRIGEYEAKKKADEEAKAAAEESIAKAKQNTQSEDAPSQAMSTGDGGAAPMKPAPANDAVDTKASVIEHQDEISSFLHSRNFSKQKENEYRAVLVEFIKHQAARQMKAAA